MKKYYQFINIKKLICIIAILVQNFYSSAQNLVPNGDFESYSTCPTGAGQIDLSLNWFNPCDPPYGSTGSDSGSPDYLHSCSTSNSSGVPTNLGGYQYPHSGDGYAGAAIYNTSFIFREYMEVQLTQPLIANNCYYFQMYVNLANISNLTTDSIGVYFSDTLVSGLHTHEPLPFSPQIKNTSGFITDTLNWSLISGNYTAAGGESFLIIGNFNDDANTDTMSINSIASGYIYIYVDDVSLSLCTGLTEQEQDGINIFPNPFTETLNCTIKNGESSEIFLYDITSRLLLNEKFKNSVSLNTLKLEKGIYLYEVRSENKVVGTGKVLKQ